MTFSRIVATASGEPGFVPAARSVLLMFNVIAGTFNLLPLPPLDGRAVIKIFLPDRLAEGLRSLEGNGAFSMLGLLLAWRVFPEIVGPLFSTVLWLVHPGVPYR